LTDNTAPSPGPPALGPIKVLHVLEALRGGTSRHVVDLVRAAPHVTHHVAVPVNQDATASGAVLDRPALTTLAEAGAIVHPVDMRRMPVHPANLVAVWRLRKLIRGIRPDVVHGHSAVGGALARISAAGLPTPAFYTPNGLPPDRASRLIEKMLGRLTTALIAVSPSEGTRAVDWGLVPPDKVRIVPNGIDLTGPDVADIDIRALAGIPPGTPVVGTVMRLVAQKAPEMFVAVCAEVAKSHPEVHFLLIGLGPLQVKVDAAVAEAGIGNRWHQIAHLPDASIALGQLDVFALLSAFEGGPYTPLEAMRAGTPVVVTDVVGNRDAVEPGVSGLVAPFGDVRALADAVGSLLEDPNRARTVGAAGRRRLEERFDVRTMGASVAALYAEAAGRRQVFSSPAVGR
jgi:glycosyltransferase involved in cell wall biosynthesis